MSGEPSQAANQPWAGRDLVIPEFEPFCAEIDRMFEATRSLTDGAVADYIPQLGRVEPEQFGVALCTIDGQRHARGDSVAEFSMQSCCKPVNYCLALEEHGEDFVHRYVGREPSGHSFNNLALNEQGRPHNPMINSGAIMCCSLIQRDLPSAERFDYVSEKWRELAGGAKLGFSNATYLSERQHGDRNFALGYFMREHGAFPDATDLVATLEFYFQCCSFETTCEIMAAVAATLAAGGMCPLTGKQVLRPETVRKCLSLMYSCGMYDFSGEWAFSIGLPAKSGVGGGILLVVPNVLGLCIWSPRLDSHGNSVRGIAFARELVKTFNFHSYEMLTGRLQRKIDPRTSPERERIAALAALCWSVSAGDEAGVRRLANRGMDLGGGDYEGRTALHLAAARGYPGIVRYLLDQGVDPSPRDVRGRTPLDDAGDRAEVVAELAKNGARAGS